MREDDLFDLEYGYWFNQANERFYSHVDLFLNLLQLVGGSTAAVAALQARPGYLQVAGIVLAVAAALALLVQPGTRAAEHRNCKGQWRNLKAQASTMEDAALHAAVATLQGSGPAGFAALAVPAYNQAVQAIGREDAVRPSTLWQRAASAMA